MVVFLDTSAFFAMANRDDPNHAAASESFGRALEQRNELLTHNYVVLESVALMTRRRGWEAARKFLSQVQSLPIRWVDESLHHAAVKRFVERQGGVSLVDEVSFLVMREARARHFLGFDQAFLDEGFLPYPAS